MIASLPMYWRAQNAPLWQAFWAQVQACAAPAGLTLPDLTPPEAIPRPWAEHWLRQDLVLSMTCGLPFRDALRGRVCYVGTLDFGLGTPAGYYRSCVIMSPGAWAASAAAPTEPPAMTLACNSADSQSGWAVTQQAPPFARPPRIAQVLMTGSHAASAEAVAEGRADIAYIDAVTYRILCECGFDTRRVHMAGYSAPSPGLPLICAAGRDPAPLRHALKQALDSFRPDRPNRMGGPMSLHLLDEADYLDLPIPVPPATA